VGIDAVDIERSAGSRQATQLASASSRRERSFLSGALTLSGLAVRFAAKEATMKALARASVACGSPTSRSSAARRGAALKISGSLPAAPRRSDPFLARVAHHTDSVAPLSSWRTERHGCERSHRDELRAADEAPSPRSVSMPLSPGRIRRGHAAIACWRRLRQAVVVVAGAAQWRRRARGRGRAAPRGVRVTEVDPVPCLRGSRVRPRRRRCLRDRVQGEYRARRFPRHAVLAIDIRPGSTRTPVSPARSCLGTATVTMAALKPGS